MTFRSDLPFWQVPLTLFQEFDHGATIEDRVPFSWNLSVGDCLEYEAGCNISGLAEVASVDQKHCIITDPSSEDLEAKVLGAICTFEKVT